MKLGPSLTLPRLNPLWDRITIAPLLSPGVVVQQLNCQKATLPEGVCFCYRSGAFRKLAMLDLPTMLLRKDAAPPLPHVTSAQWALGTAVISHEGKGGVSGAKFLKCVQKDDRGHVPPHSPKATHTLSESTVPEFCSPISH